MRTHSDIKGLRGSRLIHNRVLRYLGTDEQEVKERLEIIKFRNGFGYDAAEVAFKITRFKLRIHVIINGKLRMLLNLNICKIVNFVLE